jgi:dephospho-CoA kinase
LKTIGLTGGYCSGKNLCAERFEQRGCVVVDVDRLGHKALVEAQSEVLATFGERILATDGSIDRKALGGIVFGDRKELAKLEAIVHPRMILECIRQQERGEETGALAVVFNAALLHRMGLDNLCDVVCYVKAPFPTRFFRAKQRDGLGLKAFVSRILSQRDISADRIQGASVVYILKNSGDTAFIHRQVDSICATIGI